MYRLQLMILLALMGSATVLAQDAEPETGNDEQAEEQAASAADEVTDDEIEELLGLDEDYTEVDDDDFDPTQEVRFEQSINFPTDI